MAKFNFNLPFQITPNDPLPKTICNLCMSRVEQHHELMLKMEKHKSMFALQASRMESIRAQAARIGSQENPSESQTERSRTTACESTSQNTNLDTLGGSSSTMTHEESAGNTRTAQLELIECDDNNDIHTGGDSTENASEIGSSSD